MFLPGDDPPRAVKTLSNLSLFKLMLVICKLVLFSMGEQGFPRGQSDCWLVKWIDFEVLCLGLTTLAVSLEVVAAATAASDCLQTAMLV